ncbi:MAG: hypothetical protein Q8T08_07005 [Ignavibacteria bacterium]|nr:hypothetical protein [Ignavibacteria bacterium]
MTDKNTHAILFELQKNLEDLASAKVQMEEFRSSATSVVQGINNVQVSFVKHLTDLETDYKQRVNKLEESLISFLSTNNEENRNAIQKVASVSEKEISKGVEQFKDVSSKVETSNNEKILAITKLLETIELDYQLKLRQLQESIGSFISIQRAENKSTMLEVASNTKDAISKGVDKFSDVANKVETSNNEKILVITNLLEHYKGVVEASHSLIVTLNAIDFPSKLDDLSSKTQLIIESITNAKQALELKSNESQTSIIEKTTLAKEQIIQNTDIKFQSLTEQVNSSKENLSKTVSENFSEQMIQSKALFEKLNNSIVESVLQINAHQEKNDKNIKTLKNNLYITWGLIVFGTISTIILMNWL